MTLCNPCKKSSVVISGQLLRKWLCFFLVSSFFRRGAQNSIFLYNIHPCSCLKRWHFYLLIHCHNPKRAANAFVLAWTTLYLTGAGLTSWYIFFLKALCLSLELGDTFVIAWQLWWRNSDCKASQFDIFCSIVHEVLILSSWSLYLIMSLSVARVRVANPVKNLTKNQDFTILQ